MITTKGFTLIELLIVIGILAILATTVVLVLNPAQILAETRDTQRISDLGVVQSAIGLYFATASNISVHASWNGATQNTVGACSDQTTPNFWASVSNAVFTGLSLHANQGRSVDGTGWVPVPFTRISGGSPLSALPVDPTNSSTSGALGPATTDGKYYRYACNDANKTYEINANMESTKFSTGGGADIETPDGGNSTTLYEIGIAPSLTLF